MHSHKHVHNHCEVRGAGCNYCPSCGQKVGTSDNFCGHCGAACNCKGGAT